MNVLKEPAMSIKVTYMAGSVRSGKFTHKNLDVVVDELCHTTDASIKIDVVDLNGIELSLPGRSAPDSLPRL